RRIYSLSRYSGREGQYEKVAGRLYFADTGGFGVFGLGCSPGTTVIFGTAVVAPVYWSKTFSIRSAEGISPSAIRKRYLNVNDCPALIDWGTNGPKRP